MNWILGAVALGSAVVCLTAFVVFAFSSVWSVLLMGVFLLIVWAAATTPNRDMPPSGHSDHPER